MYDVTFSNVPPIAFERLREQLTGVHEATHTGEGLMECQGTVCRYAYDATAKSLALSVLSTPRVVTQGYIIGWVHDTLRRHNHKVTTDVKRGV